MVVVNLLAYVLDACIRTAISRRTNCVHVCCNQEVENSRDELAANQVKDQIKRKVKRFWTAKIDA